MNNMTITTFFKMIKKNIIVFFSIFGLFTTLGIIIGSFLYTNTYQVSATVSISVVTDEKTDTLDQYYESVALLIKENSLLQKTADAFNLDVKDLSDELSYRRSYGMLNITYQTGVENENGKQIVNSIINNWIEFIENKSFSGLKGTAEKLFEPTEQTDLTSSFLIFIVIFSIIGLVLGTVASTILSYFSKTFIDSVFVKSSFEYPIISKLGKNKDNELEYKKLLLEIARVNAKTVCVTTMTGENKPAMFDKFYAILKANHYNVCILDLGNELDGKDKTIIKYDGPLFNLQENSPLNKTIDELKQTYDLVLVNCEDVTTNSRLAVNKYCDLCVIDIELNKTIRKELKENIITMEKDNKNIVGVILG